MDRQIPVGNKLVDKKMKSYLRKKHRETLRIIKNKPKSHHYSLSQIQSKHNRRISASIQDKNLQIEKKNILLFNRIATIIRDKPKNMFMSNSYVRTFEQASKQRKKIEGKLKTENQLFQRRLLDQKPTIKNDQFYRDRRKNEKYLKLIGRYPYKPLNKKNQGEWFDEGSSFENERQIYRKIAEEYLVRIRKNGKEYEFVVEGQNLKRGVKRREFHYRMDKISYAEQFQKCNFDFEKLLRRLRLTDKNEMVFDYL